MSMTFIQHTELTGSQASIVFNSIPQTFTDLYVVFSLRSNSGVTVAKGNFNAVGADERRLQGSGSGTFTGFNQPGSTIGFATGSANTANTFSNNVLYIPNYTATGRKSYSGDGVTENNATEAFQNIVAGLTTTTSAITTLEIYPDAVQASQWVAGSSATLYGITRGSNGGVTVS